MFFASWFLTSCVLSTFVIRAVLDSSTARRILQNYMYKGMGERKKEILLVKKINFVLFRIVTIFMSFLLLKLRINTGGLHFGKSYVTFSSQGI